MIFNVIGLIIGIMILAAGIYYLVKERHDAESKKIYTVVTVIGLVVTIVVGSSGYWKSYKDKR